MITINALMAYILYVVLFSVLFKYGLELSFDVDPGYLGPIFIFHSILMFVLLFSQSKK
jgi:hypothetical protein